MKEQEKTIGGMIDKAGTCFISYVDEDGFPVTKAMLPPRERNGIKELWFSTNTSSNKVKSFRRNNKAGVYFMDRRFSGVSTFRGRWKCWKRLRQNEDMERRRHLVLQGGRERSGLLCAKIYGRSGELLQRLQVGAF